MSSNWGHLKCISSYRLKSLEENSAQVLSSLPENNDLSISLAPMVAFIASFCPTWGFLFSKTWMLRRHPAELRQLIQQRIGEKEKTKEPQYPHIARYMLIAGPLKPSFTVDSLILVHIPLISLWSLCFISFYTLLLMTANGVRIWFAHHETIRAIM